MIFQVILKALTGLAMRLVSEEIAKELILYGLSKLVQSSKNTWDDELLEIAKKKWDEGK